MRSTPHVSRGEQGFTLLEALVSLGLLALILASLPSTLHLARRSLAAANAVAGDATDAASLEFATRVLAQAVPQVQHTADGLQGVRFVGEPQKVDFVAPFLGESGEGGLYAFSLSAVQTASAGESLQLSWSPLGAVSGRLGEQRIVLRGATGVAMRYAGSAKAQSENWVDSWKRGRLPAAVELSYRPRGSRSVITRKIALPLGQ